MFVFENPHPEQKRVGDCVKRAIVLATGINYHDISIMLNRYRAISGTRKFNSNDNYKEFIENVLGGWKIGDNMQTANCGSRYTVEEFAEEFEDHKYILRVAKHLVCCKGGDYYDTWDSGYKSVYIAWQIAPYNIIVEKIRKQFPKLCKGLTLARR